MALTQPLQRILEQVQLALENGKVKPDVIYPQASERAVRR